MLEIVAGWDDREPLGYALCQFSAIRRTSEPLRIIPLIEKALRFQKLYRRPHEERNGQLWDVISDAPMATSFACSRFLVPWLGTGQWVLFCDFADMLFLADPAEVFGFADTRFAVQVVKRDWVPDETTKMDGQQQVPYPRKGWSSVILWNLWHPANQRLTSTMANQLPGRDLHAFCWLEEHEIGELPGRWNHLVGIDEQPNAKPALLHYTLGTPEAGTTGLWAHVWTKELEIMEAARGRIRA